MRLQPAVLCAAVATLAAQSSKSRRTADRPVEWPVYGGGPESIRYSSLTQINRANVTHLQVAWTFDASDSTVGTELEVNPIVVHGVLYATTASLNVVALNAATAGCCGASTRTTAGTCAMEGVGSVGWRIGATARTSGSSSACSSSSMHWTRRPGVPSPRSGTEGASTCGTTSGRARS